MARFRLPASQIEANDLPPVCAMTGNTAETWKKFTFRRTPLWSLAFGLLGAAAFSTRVTGHLPLTRSSSRKVTLFRSVFFDFIPLAVALWVASAAVAPNLHVDATRSAIGGWLFLAGLLSFVVAFFGIPFGRNAFGPTGKVIEGRSAAERIVELRRVHPGFVKAVNDKAATASSP